MTCLLDVAGTPWEITPGNISMELPPSMHFHKCERMARLLNLMVEGSTPWQRDVANAIAYTPQSVLLVCCSTGMILTSMHSASSTCNSAAICCLVVSVTPVKRLSYSFTSFGTSHPVLLTHTQWSPLCEELEQILLS